MGEAQNVNNADAKGGNRSSLDSTRLNTPMSISEKDMPTTIPDAIQSATAPEKIIESIEVEPISWTLDDPEHPFNWSTTKKVWTIVVIILTVLNSTMGSGLASNISQYIARDWHITNQSLLVLPTSIYLTGYILGPLIWGPLSEQYGRKGVMTWAFALFGIFMLACALAPNLAALVIFRFLTGISAAAAITVTGGVCADLYKDPEARGRAFSIWMCITAVGPTIGPIISGYLSPVSWRWTFWVALIVAGVTFVALLFCPETYAPQILKARAQRLRKETGDETIKAPLELEKTDIHHIVTVVLTRPVRMFLTEAIVFFSCIYLSFSYAIFYMSFQSYPIIYQGVYGFSLGQTGLVFLSVGVGAICSSGVGLIWDAVIRRAEARNAQWIKKEEMRRLPLACVGGPLLVVASLWLGWSARASVHWIVPVLSGVCFGCGFLLLFMALLNYIVDAYRTFAASGMAATGTVRSIWGAVLPFATRPMYEKLGIAWACSLLGFVSLLLATIPFVFIWQGSKLRANSKFCQYLLQKDQEEEEKMQAQAARKNEATA